MQKEHWEKVYSGKSEHELGWYQPDAAPSMRMVEFANISKHAHILDAGTGASVFIDDLLKEGFRNITAVDISAEGLYKTKSRIGEEGAAFVHWLVDDLANPKAIYSAAEVSFWHDRAAFHFLTEKGQVANYLQAMNTLLKPGAFAAIATFALNGAEKCSGLPVCRYSEISLAETLGDGYILIHHFNHMHYNPKGEERPFIYTLFQKK
jgi:EEF1A lysine methyltransferase 2